MLYNYFKVCFILLFASGLISIYGGAVNVEEQLITILKNQKFDESLVKGKANNITFKGNKFVLENNGVFYKVDDSGKKYPLQIYYDKSRPSAREYLIFDPSQPPEAGLSPNPLSTHEATTDETRIVDDIVSSQREYGIFTIKTINSDCYFAYAKARLGANALERVLALERPVNPRPLPFANDDDWEEFKTEIKHLFNKFKSKQSYIAFKGTSTTFFSQNPRKGRNSYLFESAPDCVKRASNPNESFDVYTFDTPGSERSDLDIDLFIPDLSALCETAGVKGNNGLRENYYENTVDQCLRISPDASLRNMVKTVPGKANTLKGALIPGTELDTFFKKWATKLDGRPINFSVAIRPDQRKGILERPEADFSNDPLLKGQFTINID